MVTSGHLWVYAINLMQKYKQSLRHFSSVLNCVGATSRVVLLDQQIHSLHLLSLTELQNILPFNILHRI